MAEDAVGESRLQLARSTVEAGKLLCGEGVEIRRVAPDEVREDGARTECLLAVETFDEGKEVVLGIEPEAAHAGVELEVDGEVGDALLSGSGHQRIEQAEIVDFRF